ncbi:hypothetical protein F5879DRAFT_386811 [Lentinula edodes]|nr:hypothetical protein F5879DRAFT_386811 [Lentinula edodes]
MTAAMPDRFRIMVNHCAHIKGIHRGGFSLAAAGQFPFVLPAFPTLVFILVAIFLQITPHLHCAMRLDFAYIVAALLTSAANVHAAPLTAASGSSSSGLGIRRRTQNTGLVYIRLTGLCGGVDFDLPSSQLNNGAIETRVTTALNKYLSVHPSKMRFLNEYHHTYGPEPPVGKGPSEILVLVNEYDNSRETFLSIDRDSVASKPSTVG